MNRPVARVLPFLVAFAVCAPASAAGLQLWQQNAAGLGVAYAGSAASLENAGSLYFNPATMTRLPGVQVSFGGAMAWPAYDYTDAAGGGMVDGGASFGTGNGFASWQLAPAFALGFGVSQPFGLKSSYSQGWVGSAQAINSQMRTVDYNPAVAWRISDRVSVGAGVSYQTLDVDMSRSGLSYRGDSGAWGWNAGALFTLSDSMRVGASWRSSVKHDLDNGGATVRLPDTAAVSVWQQVSDRWEAMGDLSYTNWSSVRSLGMPGETVDFADSWRFAWGAAYRAADAWKLRFGVAYDRSPTRESSRRIARMPDADSVWLTLGAQWNAGRYGRIDAGYAYIMSRDAPIDSTGNGIRLNGSYDNSVHILGAQYSIGF
ncbi:MAG: transporter [Betaproteobacteria bacterium]|nr:transporter [Betaproteobacteria bacterium]